MQFDLSPELAELQATVRKLAQERIAPRAREIDDRWFEGVTSVGVTSGASVPEILVRDVLDYLAGRGYDTVEEVRTATEDLMFSLPHEIRADLKAREAAKSA